jgi:hypothetical protein
MSSRDSKKKSQIPTENHVNILSLFKPLYKKRATGVASLQPELSNKNQNLIVSRTVERICWRLVTQQLKVILIIKDHTSKYHINHRWNRSGFLTTGTGTGLSRSDRTGPAGLPATDRSTVNDRSTGNRLVYR